MRCILVFDHLNDVIFYKCDYKFAKHLKRLGSSQGLLSPENQHYSDAYRCHRVVFVALKLKKFENKRKMGNFPEVRARSLLLWRNYCGNLHNNLFNINSDWLPGRLLHECSRGSKTLMNDQEDGSTRLSTNVIIQLFSPVVTSQRIMSSQFGNSYTSVQCQDGTNMVFDEFMGYLFIYVGSEEVCWLKRMLGVSITIIRFLCGPDIAELKQNRARRSAVCRLLDRWVTLADTDQSVLVEATEQLSVSPELASAAINALREATESMKEHPRSHALIFVENKFLSLYSSRFAVDLSACDLLLLSLMGCSSRDSGKLEETSDSDDLSSNDDEFYSPQGSPPAPARRHNNTAVSESDLEMPCTEGSGEGLRSELVLLSGQSTTFTPHVLYLSHLADGVTLLLLQQVGSESVCEALNQAFAALASLLTAGSAMEAGSGEALRRCFDTLEAAMKRLFEGLKKSKKEFSPHIESCIRVVHSKWDFIRKRYSEDLRAGEGCGEASFAGLVVSLRELLQLTCLSKQWLPKGQLSALTAASRVQALLADFTSFLRVKALRNYTLSSRASLSINKYLEEFPGLVHFIYIDRTNHRVTTPTLDFSAEQTISLTKNKIWSMVEFSRTHLQDGHLAIMWKDTTFSYAFYLWFEDSTGTPQKPKVNPASIIKSLPIPGIMAGDFYRRLAEGCFPKGKIRCYELYCIHLGLATASCVLEHSRRLAATIWEVTGLPSNPLDLI